MNSTKLIILTLIFGVIGGFLAYHIMDNVEPSLEDLIKEFYDVETAVSASPHHIRKAMSKGKIDFILVDLRSKEEYEIEHIVGAVSIPAYKNPYESAYGDVERIVNGFKELIENNPEKEIIVYCYSMPCMTGRKIGKMLADHEIYVKHLGIGWNEWRYFWNLWNHEPEWNVTNVEDFVYSGPEPGVPPQTNSTVCAIDNKFGC